MIPAAALDQQLAKTLCPGQCVRSGHMGDGCAADRRCAATTPGSPRGATNSTSSAASSGRPVAFDNANTTLTSARRLDQGLFYNLVVSGLLPSARLRVEPAARTTLADHLPRIPHLHTYTFRRPMRWRVAASAATLGLVLTVAWPYVETLLT